LAHPPPRAQGEQGPPGRARADQPDFAARAPLLGDAPISLRA
jgi:hypothetical protein